MVAQGKAGNAVLREVNDTAPRTVVAEFKKISKYSVAIPGKSDAQIIIPKDKRSGAKHGQKVLVRIENVRGSIPKGRVLRVLGWTGEPAAEELGIIFGNGIPFEFPEKVKREAENVPGTVSEAEAFGRKDFRGLLCVTIDGEDTRDFDDAVSIEKRDGVFMLGVHIADVAHYVKEGSAIDKEALKRGNSVYLPDRVIPMLPFALSNGICSLKEKTDRLALSVIMEVDGEGNVISHEIYESVINIDRRFTYTEVADIIENGGKHAEMFGVMAELAGILSKKRAGKGALDFDVPESKVILDKQGNVADIGVYERNVATRIIEEFMVLCNETIAETFFWSETPFVYRTHEPPDSEDTAALAEFLKGLGMTIKGNRLHPKELQKIIENAANTSEERIVKKAVLRAMKQARYSGVNIGHFGLSLERYCHFTSPIRRYADLQIHRIIKESMRGVIDGKRHKRLVKRTEIVSSHVSRTERAAETVERESVRLWKCVYMQDKTGSVYEGVISHIARHGIYVELPNTVEGMVSLHTLNDDYYVYEGDRFIGESNGRVFRAGERVKVKVKNVSVKDRYIDFIFI